MKFCPYCGAPLPGGAASFCPECGKRLPQRGPAAPKKPGKHTSKPARKAPLHQPSRRPPQNPMNENYDGYYNDVRPIDAGMRGEGMDPELVKRIVFVILGAVGIIALATILMMLL